MKSPEWGTLYRFNTDLHVDNKVNTIGVRYGEHTMELTFNDTFGVNSYLSCGGNLPSLNRMIYLKPKEQIIGVYGKVLKGTDS